MGDKKQEELNYRAAEEAIEEDFEIADEIDEKNKPVKNPLRNQFNFSERAAQSKNPVLRDRGWTTEPPPTTGFSETVTQWAIFDKYMHDIEVALAKEKEEKMVGKPKDKDHFDDS